MAIQRRRSKVSIAIILFALSFGLVTQIRSQVTPRVSLLDQPEADLAEIIDRLQLESDRTRTDIEELRLRETQYQAASSSQADIAERARVHLEDLRVLAGVSTVESEGLRITISDREGVLTGFDLRELTDELRASGSAALSLNGTRLLAESSFARRSGKVFADGKVLKRPYVFEVAGDANTLFQAVTLPRGVRDKLTAFRGVSVKVMRVPKVVIPPRKV